MKAIGLYFAAPTLNTGAFITPEITAAFTKLRLTRTVMKVKRDLNYSQSRGQSIHETITTIKYDTMRCILPQVLTAQSALNMLHESV